MSRRGVLSRVAQVAVVRVEDECLTRYHPRAVDLGALEQGATVFPITRTGRKYVRSHAVRCAVVALVLPAFLIAPGQAGALLLHHHDDESTHVHHFHHGDSDGWHRDHARQHLAGETGHENADESSVIMVGATRNSHAPSIVLPLTREQLGRPARPDNASTTRHIVTMRLAVEIPSALTPDTQSGELLPAHTLRADLPTLDATAALLLRNHTLLL